jgi:hypothetical protein
MSYSPRVARTRRLLRIVLAAIFAAAITLPILAGPFMGAAIRLVGGEPEHMCLCGMKAGECGCPECIRLEKQRQDDRTANVPIVRSGCTDDEAVITGPALPLGIESEIVALVPAPHGGTLFGLAPPSHDTQIVRAPPTPPPRA